MCRLFGLRSAVLSRAHRSLVDAENAVARQARHHRDGWGIAWFHQGEAWLLKSPAGAADCPSFRRASARLASHTLVVHVRKATVGEPSPFNLHPFRYGRWVFAHNGTVHGFERVGPRLRAEMSADLRSRVLGTTDTETLFFWLMGRLAEAGIDPLGPAAPHPDRLHPVLAAAFDALLAHAHAAGAERPVVNYLLTDGRVFVAQRSGRELWFATQRTRCADAGVCPWPDRACLQPTRFGDRVNRLLVASEPIGEDDRWEPVPDDTQVLLSEDFRLSVRPLSPRDRGYSESAIQRMSSA